jgi:hypothetical protein
MMNDGSEHNNNKADHDYMEVEPFNAEERNNAPIQLKFLL